MIGGPTLLFKSECLNSTGGFDTNLPSLQDHDFVLRLSQKYKAAFVPEVLLFCGSTGDNMQSSNMTYFKATLSLIIKWKDSFKKYPDSRKKFLSPLYQNAELLGIKDQIENIVNGIFSS